MKALEIIDFEKINDTEEEKVNEIAESIKANGWQGCPILTHGNTLITGSHRLDALRKLYEEEYDISDMEVAVDVSDIIDEKIENGMDPAYIFGNLDNIGEIFEGTWVEEYKSEIAEW